MSEEIVYEDATTLAGQIRAKERSSAEVVSAFCDRIESVDGVVNAIPTRLEREAALALAREADRAVAAGEDLGPLHGLPIAIKDAQATAGMRTTMGSPVFADWVPDHDAELVRRVREAGAIVIGKTNLPEFGAGSHTFNPVFGVTRNPYDTTKSAGGSSGGAAAALASGMLPIADGSDLGGSLRNPASFCNVVGLRPSVGRVPDESPGPGWLARMTVSGPMGRSVGDVALLLSAISGYDAGDPLSIEEDPGALAVPLGAAPRGLRLGWGGDLGFLPVEPEILDVCASAAAIFEGLGATVEASSPDFRSTMPAFQVQRALAFAQTATMLEQVNPAWRSMVKDTVLWNVDQGLALEAEDVARSDAERAALYRRVMDWFTDHDFLLLPSAQVLPFDVETEWPREVAGVPMETYVDWMEVCCVVSLTGLPAISVPAGFSEGGLPIGLQIVGRPRADRALLEVAHAFEQATHVARARPSLSGTGLPEPI